MSIATLSHAQMTVRQEKNMNKLVREVLVGRGIVVSNIIFRGDTAAIGVFNGTNSNVGLDSGIVISTGKAEDAVGPNNRVASTSNNQTGDADLNTIATDITLDAASLQFDFVPVSDQVKFRFVFGSEEYYIDDIYNDVFGFFINGPGFTGRQNIGLIPGTTTPITINTINDNVNSNLFIDNRNGLTVQYNGFTKVIEIVAKVQPCAKYTIKFAIADVKDRAYDSGILIEAESFSSDNKDDINVKKIYPLAQTVNEGCDSVVFRFTRADNNTTNAQTVNYSITGDVTPGVDFTNAATGSVQIPAGSMFTDLVIRPFDDLVTETPEKLKIQVVVPGLCFPSADSVTVLDLDTLKIDTFLTVNCKGDTTYKLVVTSGGSGNFGYNWMDSTGLSVSTSAILIVNPSVPTMYYIEVFDSCTNELVLDSVVIDPIIPVIITSINDTVVCGGSLLQLTSTSDFPNSSFLWTARDSGGGQVGIFSPNDTIANPKFLVPNGVYEMYLTVTITNEGTCPKDVMIKVSVIPKGIYGKNPVYICQGQTAQLTAYGGKKYKWTPSTGLSNDTIANPTTSIAQSYTVEITDSIGCVLNAPIEVKVDTLPIADAGKDVWICKRSSIELTGSGSQYDTYEWSPKESLSNYKAKNPIATPIQTTTYVLKAKNNACFTFDSVVVHVIDTAMADFEMVVDSCAKTIALLNKTTGTDSVFWDFGDGTTSLDKNPVHKYDNTGTFKVKLLANRNTDCKDSLEMQLNLGDIKPEERKIPNVFTPNGDGINDTFKITGGNVHCIIKRISIYNRWGKLMHETEDKNELDWDGKVSNGSIVAPGVYFYVVEGDGFKDTGTITVIL